MIGKNNPYNIRFYKQNQWIGLNGQSNGFCNFKSEIYATRAMLRILNRYVYVHHLSSVSDFFYRFAPLSENDTSNYIRIVVNYLVSCGFTDVIRFDFDFLAKLFSIIQHVEIGRSIDSAYKSVVSDLSVLLSSL